jgi:cysteine desulfurase
MSEYIYFDNSATTPLDPRVRQSMDPFLDAVFGNPSSLHQMGREAREAVEIARQQVADLIGAQPNEIIFTASGTEADNMALIGVIEKLQLEHQENHIITSAIEHPAILETCRYLQRRGVEVTYLSVTSDGIVEPDELRRAMRPHTRLVSIMAANNVVGTLQPIAELSGIAHEQGVLFHTDAVQAAGKIPIDVRNQPIDLLSLSAHKLNGPKGVGALYVRSEVPIAPIIYGGGQEQGLRSATENVAGIVGLGRSALIAREEMSSEAARLVQLRDHLVDSIATKIPNAYLIGHRFRRLPGHVCLGLSGQEGEAIKLMLALDQSSIAISTGSACSAHHIGEPSYILLAMGFDPFQARGSLRITLGRFNTNSEVEHFLDTLTQLVLDLRMITTYMPKQA